MGKHSGASFEEREVVDNYIYRPPYPMAIFQRLLELTPEHEAMLDIGCGPGKMSRPMTRLFKSVTAVDPSSNMIALGQSLPEGNAPNLHWINGLAEEASLGDDRFDLMVAAASIHWMDHERLFPKLAKHAKPQHVFAVISGDTPDDPPWEDDWTKFLEKWVPVLTGAPFDPVKKREVWQSYRDYLDLAGSEDVVSAPFSQSVEDFIRCQHSRDTFTPSRLGDLKAAFDAELSDILRGHAVNGELTFRVRTRLTWGTIR
jgi:ubiquinone/menaquinone biosynthesis C-methylase UbiE